MSLISLSKSTPVEVRPRPLAGLVLSLIYIYKALISPILVSLFGPMCRYQPTCSDYALQAVRKYGAWHGSIMAVKRVLRCHPWHEGGYDPVK